MRRVARHAIEAPAFIIDIQHLMAVMTASLKDANVVTKKFQTQKERKENNKNRANDWKHGSREGKKTPQRIRTWTREREGEKSAERLDVRAMQV